MVKLVLQSRCKVFVVIFDSLIVKKCHSLQICHLQDEQVKNRSGRLFRQDLIYSTNFNILDRDSRFYRLNTITSVMTLTPHKTSYSSKLAWNTKSNNLSIPHTNIILELRHLNLEASGSPASTGLLELSALGDNTGLDAIVSVRVGDAGAVTEVGDRLTRGLGTTEKDGVGALGGAEGELIQGDALTAGLDNSGTGSLGESKSSDGELRDLEKTRIISDGTDNDGGLALLSLHVSRQAGDRNRGVVDLGHSQSLDDGQSELGLSTSGKETVIIHTQV